MRMILEQLETIAEAAKENSPDDGLNESQNIDEKLNLEQVKEVEKNLKELKILSDMCKQQRADVENLEEEDCSEDDEGDIENDESQEEDGDEDEELQEEENFIEMDVVDASEEDSLKTGITEIPEEEENKSITQTQIIKLENEENNTSACSLALNFEKTNEKLEKNIRRRLRREY